MTAVQFVAWGSQTSLTSPVAVGLHRVERPDEPTGIHVGLFYQGAAGTPQARVLHLAWHHLLRDDLPEARWDWHLVLPRVNPLQLRLALAHCRNMAEKRAKTQIPYGLRHASSTLKEVQVDGEAQWRLAPGEGETGLTCATFVLVVFKLAGVDLLELSSWKTRDDARAREDSDEQKRLVSALREHGAGEQADAIEREHEVGSLRYRPEEVGAASGLEKHPLSYAQVKPEGEALRGQLLSPTGPQVTRAAPKKSGSAKKSEGEKKERKKRP